MQARACEFVTHDLQDIPKQKFFEIRNMLIKCVLSTDMSKHFELIKNFKASVDSKAKVPIDWQVFALHHRSTIKLLLAQLQRKLGKVLQCPRCHVHSARAGRRAVNQCRSSSLFWRMHIPHEM